MEKAGKAELDIIDKIIEATDESIIGDRIKSYYINEWSFGDVDHETRNDLLHIIKINENAWNNSCDLIFDDLWTTTHG